MSALAELQVGTVMRNARIAECELSAAQAWEAAEKLRPFVPTVSGGRYDGNSAQWYEFDKVERAYRAARGEVKELEEERRQDGGRLDLIRKEALEIARQANNTDLRMAELDADIVCFKAHLKDAKGATREALAKELAGRERDLAELEARYPTILERLRGLVGHDNHLALLLAAS